MSKRPYIGLLMEPLSQSRLKMAKISYFFNEKQLSSNHISSEIFEILVVDNKMVRSCGDNEPHTTLKKAYFS